MRLRGCIAQRDTRGVVDDDDGGRRRTIVECVMCIYVFTASGVSRMKINQTPHKRIIIILHIIIIIIIRSYDGGIRTSACRP